MYLFMQFRMFTQRRSYIRKFSFAFFLFLYLLYSFWRFFFFFYSFPLFTPLSLPLYITIFLRLLIAVFFSFLLYLNTFILFLAHFYTVTLTVIRSNTFLFPPHRIPSYNFGKFNKKPPLYPRLLSSSSFLFLLSFGWFKW